ncbi:MAG: hypothetical protein Q9165_008859 [Trypethelium subeluteriae]
MVVSLQDTESLLGRYKLEGKPGFFDRMKRFGASESTTAALILDGEMMPTGSTRMQNLWDRLKWTMKDKTSLNQLIADLRSHNDALQNFLDLTAHTRAELFYGKLLRVLSTSPVSETIASREYIDAPTGEEISRLEDAQIVTVCQLSNRARTLSPPDSYMDGGAASESQGSLPSQPSLLTPFGADTLRLQKALLRLLPKESSDAFQIRDLASYQDQQVLVEWRYYSRSLSPDQMSLLDNRIHMLVMQLRQSSAIEDFKVLPCLGYLHCDDQRRYGLVFNLPSGSSTVQTLHQMLTLDYRREPKMKRNLDDRLQLGKALTICLYRFFSTGWMHKNVRSDSILLCHNGSTPLGMDCIPSMYFGGYHFTRRESPQETTERLPSVFNDASNETEWRLYTHPKAHSSTAGSASNHRMLYDVYSLGIVLLEIALWCPVVKLRSRKLTVLEFQSSIWDRYERQLRHNVGVKYAEIVRTCLAGDFAPSSSKNIEGGMDDSLEARENFLAGFEESVVAAFHSLL